MIHWILDHLIFVGAALCVLSFLGFVSFWGTAHWYRYFQIKKKFSNRSRPPQSLFKVVDGIKLHYFKEGSGPDILLIHGLGANVYCWRKLMPLLSKNHRVWAIDLKGFGLSEKPRHSSYSLHSQAALLGQFMDDEKVKNLTVVGNSMGSAVASQLTLDRQDLVQKVILINSAHDPRMFSLIKPFAKIMKAATPAAGFFSPFVNEQSVKLFIRNIYGNEKYEVTDEDVRSYLAPYMDGTDSHQAFLSAFQGLLEHNLTEDLKKIQNRILILWGKGDRVTPLKYGEILHQDLPQSPYFVHPTGGHHLQEEEPEWVSQQIDNYLQN